MKGKNKFIRWCLQWEAIHKTKVLNTDCFLEDCVIVRISARQFVVGIKFNLNVSAGRFSHKVWKSARSQCFNAEVGAVGGHYQTNFFVFICVFDGFFGLFAATAQDKKHCQKQQDSCQAATHCKNQRLSRFWKFVVKKNGFSRRWKIIAWKRRLRYISQEIRFVFTSWRLFTLIIPIKSLVKKGLNKNWHTPPFFTLSSCLKKSNFFRQQVETYTIFVNKTITDVEAQKSWALVANVLFCKVDELIGNETGFFVSRQIWMSALKMASWRDFEQARSAPTAYF